MHEEGGPLMTDLEIKREAKRKSRIAAIIMLFVLLIYIIIPILIGGLPKENLIPIIILFSILFGMVIVIIIVVAKNLLPRAFEESEYAKRGEEYTSLYLSRDEYKEVMPKQNVANEFVLSLQDIAKFYAIINSENDRVGIYIKFNFEKEMRKYEEISKAFFCDYYDIK